MSAINWAATLDAIDANIGDATGATLEIGQQIRAALYKLGQEYDERFSVQVSDAKDAFEAIATAAHDEADRVCRYAESLFGAAGPPLPVNLYSNVAALARCDAAIVATDGEFLKRALRAARSKVLSTYVTGDPITTGRYMNFRGTETRPDLRNYTLSVREIEISMQAQIAAAGEWISLVQYV
ncbi:hypothetical protein BE17_10815 [Sorangium cellulosum]|uniref:Uncharacterized protein n=1 Tax=Sorangium cellulosum TaxID=56 RepID=A0A150R8D5_SORCE|nr:hypothetical protein BE17_10815 [Sorangium cellulosum]